MYAVCGTTDGPHRAAENGLRQIVRRARSQRLINIGKMLAIEFVEFAVVGRMMFRAIPPVPVAAFGDQDFFESQLPLRFAGRRSSLGIKIAGVVEIVPGAVVFRRTDPDVEIGVNPRARNQRRQLAETAGAAAMASETVTASTPGSRCSAS